MNKEQSAKLNDFLLNFFDEVRYPKRMPSPAEYDLERFYTALMHEGFDILPVVSPCQGEGKVTKQQMINLIAITIDNLLFKPYDVVSIDVRKEAYDVAKVVWAKIEEKTTGTPLPTDIQKILENAYLKSLKKTERVLS